MSQPTSQQRTRDHREQQAEKLDPTVTEDRQRLYGLAIGLLNNAARTFEQLGEFPLAEHCQQAALVAGGGRAAERKDGARRAPRGEQIVEFRIRSPFTGWVRVIFGKHEVIRQWAPDSANPAGTWEEAGRMPVRNVS